MPLLAILGTTTLLIGHPAGWSLYLLQAILATMCGIALLMSRPDSQRASGSQWVTGGCLAAICASGVLQNVLETAAVPSEAWKASIAWGTLTAVFIVTTLLAASHRQRGWFLNVFASFGVAVCILAMAQFYTSDGKMFWMWPTAEPRVLGPFLSRNNYASFTLLLLPVTLWKGLGSQASRDNAIDWNWLSAAALVYASAIASGSRAGAVLATLELPVFFLIARGGSKKAAAAFALLAAVAVGISGWELLGNKLGEENPLLYRKEMIRSALDMVAQRPMTGWGLGAFPRVYPQFARFDTGLFVNHAHNDWAEWAAEGGLPVILAMLLFAAVSLKAALRCPWAIGLAAICLHALVDYPMQRLGLMAWVVAVAAVALASQAAREERHSATN